jgi:drug/metabolite transporter (DMT)-like permease
MPVIGALLAAFLLAEPIRWFHIVGIALIGLGIVNASRKPGQRRARSINDGTRP